MGRLGAITITAVLSGVFLAGCGAPESGTVTKKDYDSAWTQMVTNCHPVGKTQVCNTTPIYHPEHWQLRLKNGTKEGWRSVSETEYNKYKVGDQYP